MATEKKNSKREADEDFKVLGPDPKNKHHQLVRIQARNFEDQVVNKGEFSMPYLDAPIEVHERYFGNMEELLLNAYRNKLVQIRAGLKSEGKKAGRGGLANALRRKSA